ncbi:MAG TPA: glutamate--tRNA ligase family protein [Gemmatimonadales bacterium]|nr:glutamate--tRNA ligase family protein [Gemmatimonadales bacterium]
MALPNRPLTRFAPSPTGYLHLGHVANAIYVWGIARALGGRVLLRLEDHDRGRCRPAYETSLLEDLLWLGLEPDLGTVSEFRRGPSPCRQSDRGVAYERALGRLAAAAPVYACDCSRKNIAGGSEAVDGETRYPGRCRDRGLSMGKNRGVRVALDAGVEQFTDGFLGEQEQDPSLQCGDLLLRDRLGNWTYQFAVTVDDFEQRVDLVIRGQDLLPSTGRQIRLARMLGRPRPPVFVHHPLIRHPSGAKLSKANHDTGIRDLRQAGVTAATVLGRAAHLTGLLEQPRELEPRDLPELFIGRASPFHF